MATLDADVSSEDQVVGIFMHELVFLRVSEILRLGDVLGHVADEPHVFNIVVDEVVV